MCICALCRLLLYLLLPVWEELKGKFKYRQGLPRKDDVNVSYPICYSSDAFYLQQLDDFVTFGENKPETHGLFTVCATEINDGPKEEPLGLRRKLPPFKGWNNLNF